MSRFNDALQGLAAAPALLRSGVLRPVGPARLARMAEAVWKYQASPATACAIAAVRWPDQVAVIDERGELGYAELDRRAGRFAAALAADCGLRAGDTLAVMCRNHRGFVEAMVAAGQLGADMVLLNTELPASALGQILRRHRIGAVVCDEEFVPAFAAAGYAGPLVVAWHDGEPDSTIDRMVSRAPDGRPPRPRRPGKIVILTSGTTGVPKGVPRNPHALDIVGIGVSAIGRLGVRTGESMLVAPPLFHGFGLAFLGMATAMGDAVVLRRKFDAAAALAAIERHRVSTVLAVPVMLQRMVDLPDGDRYDTSSLRALFSGASALTPALTERLTARFGPVVFNGYGSSEVGVVSIATPADLAAAPGTVGRSVVGVRVRIVDDAGADVPTGQIGRIFVGSAMTFEGYTGGAQAAETVGDLVGIGDVGHVDERGRLFVDGRADDMIVSGGENVFPGEVEDALARHPAVAEVAVIGVPDEEFGQRLKAFAVLVPGRSADADELKAHVRTLLARYMVPREFEFVDALPRNATGKVLRAQLS